MFTKDTEKLESLIGANTEIQGELNVKGTLRIDGQVDGRLNAEWIILSETAVVKGEVTAKKIMVGGKVEGNLRAQEVVEIKAKGKVFGDIFTNKLSVREGGEFNGKIEMNLGESKGVGFESEKVKGDVSRTSQDNLR
jgi:cytoskeletal protein CcmA (bactofilin family)